MNRINTDKARDPDQWKRCTLRVLWLMSPGGQFETNTVAALLWILGVACAVSAAVCWIRRSTLAGTLILAAVILWGQFLLGAVAQAIDEEIASRRGQKSAQASGALRGDSSGDDASAMFAAQHDLTGGSASLVSLASAWQHNRVLSRRID